MKITESQLRQLIDEEITLMVENGELDEGFLDRLRARAAGLGGRAKAKASELGAGAASALGADTAAGEMTRKAGERQTGAQAQEVAKIINLSAKKVNKATKYLAKMMKDVGKNLKAIEGTDESGEWLGAEGQKFIDDLYGPLEKLNAVAQEMGGYPESKNRGTEDELDDDE